MCFLFPFAIPVRFGSVSIIWYASEIEKYEIVRGRFEISALLLDSFYYCIILKSINKITSKKNREKCIGRCTRNSGKWLFLFRFKCCYIRFVSGLVNQILLAMRMRSRASTTLHLILNLINLFRHVQCAGCGCHWERENTHSHSIKKNEEASAKVYVGRIFIRVPTMTIQTRPNEQWCASRLLHNAPMDTWMSTMHYNPNPNIQTDAIFIQSFNWIAAHNKCAQFNGAWMGCVEFMEYNVLAGYHIIAKRPKQTTNERDSRNGMRGSRDRMGEKDRERGGGEGKREGERQKGEKWRTEM